MVSLGGSTKPLFSWWSDIRLVTSHHRVILPPSNLIFFFVHFYLFIHFLRSRLYRSANVVLDLKFTMLDSHILMIMLGYVYLFYVDMTESHATRKHKLRETEEKG